MKPEVSALVDAAALRLEFHRLLRRNVGATLDRMRDKEGKIVLNSDDLFKMLPQYADSPNDRKILGPLLYPVAAEFTDLIYKRLISAPVRKNDTVVFTAGGSATGKSTILRTATRRPGVEFLVDTTFSDNKRAFSQVARALASGRKVEIHYVHRDFAKSVLAMLRRALDIESGRIVPVDAMAVTHFGAQRTVLEALEKYENNSRVSIALKENGGKGKLKALSEQDMDKRLHSSIDKLQKIGQRVLDEFFKSQRARWKDQGKNQDSGGKNLYVSPAFYEAARSQAQTRGSHSLKGDA